MDSSSSSTNNFLQIHIHQDGDSGVLANAQSIASALLTAVSATLKQQHSSWSSSSGSFYDDDEEPPTTSPIDLEGKWYWNSPTSSGSPSTDCTHESEYPSRSNSLKSACSQRPTATSASGHQRKGSQLFSRPVKNRDPSGPQEVLAKRMESTREIDLVQRLNTTALRLDPWNPSPPLVSIVAATPLSAKFPSFRSPSSSSPVSDEPWAIFEPLSPVDNKPFETVEEALDFVMQLLQGLVFMKENGIVHGDLHSGAVMMDKGVPSSGTGGERLSRIQRNIRYHLVDFTHASVVQQGSEHLFRGDLRDLGLLIDCMCGASLPELSDLILKMTDAPSSPYLADDSQALFNAVCALTELEELVADMSVERLQEPL